MKNLAFLLSSVVAFSLGGCSNNVRYDSDYKSDINFSDFKTYSWHTGNHHNTATDQYFANDIVDDRIKASIENELSSMGYQKVAGGESDFQVNYSVTTEDKVDIRTYNTYGGFGPDWGYGGFYYSPYYYYGAGYLDSETETRIIPYVQGTFVLDVINNDDKLIWRGTAEGKMTKEELSPEERDDKIQEIVGNVLSRFPPT